MVPAEAADTTPPPKTGLAAGLGGLFDWVTDRAGLWSWLIVAVGVLLQVANYLGGKSLWIDEAYLAFNFAHHSAGEMAGPLYYSQVAPLGWLVGEDVLFKLTGSLEYGLRLLPLVMGIASLVVFRGLALRLFNPFGALAALLLLALAPSLVEFAANVKPYSTDIFMTVLILSLATPQLERPSLSARAAAGLIVAGLAAVVMSFPAVYILAAAGGTLFCQFTLQRRWRDSLVIAGVSALWLAGFAALYLLVYTKQAHSGELLDQGPQHFFRRMGFAPLPPKSLADVAWYGHWALDFGRYFFRNLSILPAAVLLVIGLVSLARRRPWLGLMLIAPLLLALLGSGLEAYPLYGRFGIFLEPTLFLIAGAGVAALAASRVRLWAMPILAAEVLVGPALLLAKDFTFRPPFATTHVTPAIRAIAKGYQPGDLIYVEQTMAPAYLVYRPQFPALAKQPFTVGYQLSWLCLARDPQMGASRRVWVLTGGVPASVLKAANTADRAAMEATGGVKVTSLAMPVDIGLLRLDREPTAASAPLDPTACPAMPPMTGVPEALKVGG